MKKNLYTFSVAALMLFSFGAKAQIIGRVAGTGTNGYTGDGVSATTSGLNNPGKAVVDAAGNVYIADKANSLIRKVNTSGIITTIAGTVGSIGFNGDGAAATAAILNNPLSVGLDASGNNLYIADFGNNRIRKVNFSTGIITTVAGSTSGFGGDGGAATAANLSQPTDVTLDAAGNIYICDYANHHIRKVNPAGIISSIAGTSGGFAGDGGAATAAQLYAPNGVCVDGIGNVYIADLGNQRVRKVDAAGIITTYAGSVAGFAGDGGAATAAQLNDPSFVTTDIAGNVFITWLALKACQSRMISSTVVPFAGALFVAMQNKLPAAVNRSLFIVGMPPACSSGARNHSVSGGCDCRVSERPQSCT